jgi:hypothetical protein
MPVRQHWLPPPTPRWISPARCSASPVELDSLSWHAGRSPFEAERSRCNRMWPPAGTCSRAVPGDHEPLLAALDRLFRRAA